MKIKKASKYAGNSYFVLKQTPKDYSAKSERRALKAITIYPAQICRVADRVGSLEAGKDADIAIFDDLPTRVSARTLCTMIEGKVVYADESFSLPACGKNV